MPNHDDVTDTLHALGIRAPSDALRALVTHLTKSHASPVQCFEQLVALERRERDARNLERRNKAATLGAFRPSTASTGATLAQSTVADTKSCSS